MLPEETDHFEDVQTSPWRPIYHAGRLLHPQRMWIYGSSIIGEEKEKRKEKKKKKKEDEEEDPLLPAPGKCRGTNTLGEFAK